MHAFTRGDALQSLERLLASSLTQAVVARVNWETFKPIYESRGRQLLQNIQIENKGQHQSKASSPLLNELRTRPAVQRLELLHAYVRDKVSELLGIDNPERLDPAQGFFEMGMDSMMAVALKRQLDPDLGLTLPRTVAFEHHNVNALAAFLNRQFASSEPPESAESLLDEKLKMLEAKMR
jgi:acyl carrier protein